MHKLRFSAVFPEVKCIGMRCWQCVAMVGCFIRLGDVRG